MVAESDDTLASFAFDGKPGDRIELDATGLVVRSAGGAFEARGKPELECVVGKTFLERETCADRAKDGLVAAWIRRTMAK